MKLDVKAFGLTNGLIWGLGAFLLTWWVIIFDGPSCDPVFIAKVYRGYSITWSGSLIGLTWGFFDGLILGVVFAWLYNRLAGSAKA